MINSVEDLNNLLEGKRTKINKLVNIMNFHEAAEDIEAAYETSKAINMLEKEYIQLLQNYIIKNN